MQIFKNIIPILLLTSVTTGVFAQATKINNDPDAEFKTAKEWFMKEQYSLAYPAFKTMYNEKGKYSAFPFTLQLELKYYYVLCGLKLNDTAAEHMAVEFIELEHNVPRVQMMCYHLGEYYFDKKDYADALTYYNKSGIDNLSNEEIAAMKFHKAYVYFTMQRFKDARPLFNAIRQIKSDPNYMDANYYYGFICFSEKNYNEALEAFTIAESHPDYQNVIPFYIAEIYYFQGEHDKALDYAEKLIKKGGQYYDLQLKQLAGHLLFDGKEYDRATPYLEEYVAKTEKIRPEDMYELSYCYYAGGNYTKAIDGFKQLSGKEDSLAQNSMYLLADAYLKTNQKANARNAFLFCSLNNSNPAQKEVSSFNYAKLSYELGYLDVALRALQNFITNYPSSPYVQEAKELQISVLAKTSNFKDALTLFESLPMQSENVKKVYPVILYGRATELINDQQTDKADALFTRIMQIPYNTQQLPLVYFWKGEIAYRKADIDAAINYFANYLKDPVTNGEVNIANARYNIAYCLMKKEEYTKALQYFQQVSRTLTPNASPIQADAYIRSADCYFMNKNFRQALAMYENVINMNMKGADYAMYQKAIIAGATNKNAEKIALLQSLSNRYPASTLLPEADLEVANTYMADEKFNEAITPLQSILKNKSAEPLWPKAYLKSGVAYFNLNKNDDALSQFKQLVAKYPNSSESDEAIEYIRNIFVENQQPSEFVAFMKQNGKPITYSEEDSLTYRSAQIKYDDKDFNNALSGFAAYLSKFPDGRYAIEANYFSAEINIVNKNSKDALTYYNAVAAKAPNKYAERSALQSARIYYFDLKDYSNAEKYFILLKSLATQQENKLEAMRGLLRCQFKLQQWKDAVANAQDLLLEKGIAADDRMMANMVLGKSYQLDNQLDDASNAYKQVVSAGISEFGAEAQYHVAEILLQQDKLKDAEKAGFEVIKKFGSYQFWVTKSYILLGDVYFKEKDYFNAEATYKSVVENATIDDLKKEATDKLALVVAEKNKSQKVDQEQQ
ncbi:MAG: tetratricopeptide repeat protein [Bacteroidota bacterium]|nr:tetratricopeptide repeat protein [Bacteroidota bacterium]